MRLRTALANNRVVRALYQHIFVTGDNVRLAVQQPVIRALLPTRVARALDGGAGSGEYTRRLLLPRALEVVVLDLDQASLGRLASRLRGDEKRRCRLVRGSVADIPCLEKRFDLVLLCEVLEHCPDDGAVLDEIARVLTPGGALVIAVPVPPAPYPDGAHVREGYTLEELTALLEQHAFEVRAHRYCMFRWSRALLRLKAGFPLPLPLLPLVHLERYLGPARDPEAGADLLPYDLVVRATRRV